MKVNNKTNIFLLPIVILAVAVVDSFFPFVRHPYLIIWWGTVITIVLLLIIRCGEEAMLAVTERETPTVSDELSKLKDELRKLWSSRHLLKTKVLNKNKT
jgi:hypothetical protein